MPRDADQVDAPTVDARAPTRRTTGAQPRRPQPTTAQLPRHTPGRLPLRPVQLPILVPALERLATGITDLIRLQAPAAGINPQFRGRDATSDFRAGFKCVEVLGTIIIN